MNGERSHRNAVDCRLNPFAFATDTTIRFYLLLVMVAVVSPLLLFSTFSSYSEAGKTINSCIIQGLVSGGPMQLISALSVQTYDALAAVVFESSMPCLKPLMFDSSLFIACMMLGLLFLSYVFYKLYPRWSLRRFQAAGPELSEIATSIDQLSSLAGLKERPALWWAPLSPRPEARTLGCPGNHYLILSSGVLALYFRDRPAFRAIVLHELSHIWHKDTRKIFFARALWWTFFFIIVLPYIVTLTVVEPWDGALLDSVSRAAILTLLIYFTQQSVFRAREYYADAQAVVWDNGHSKPMRSGLHYLQADRSRKAPKLLVAQNYVQQTFQKLLSLISTWLSDSLSYHPRMVHREQAVVQPDFLLQSSVATAFVVGVVAAVALVNLVGLSFVIIYSAMGSPESHLDTVSSPLIFLPIFIASAISSAFLIASIGLGVWRATFAEQILLTRFCSPISLGLATSIGFALGDILGFGLYFRLGSTQGELVPPAASGFAIPFTAYGVWLAALAISLSLIFYWLRATARAWANPCLINPALRVIYFVALLVTWIVLLIGFPLMVMVPHAFRGLVMLPALIPPALAAALQSFLDIEGWLENMINTSAAEMLKTTLQLIFFTPASLWVVIILLGFPLAAWFFRRPRVISPKTAWIFLDSPKQSFFQRISAVTLHPKKIIVTSLGGSLVFVALIPIINGVLAPTFIADIVYNEQSIGLRKFLGVVGCAALFQSLIAIAVCSQLNHLRVVQSLAACVFAGIVMAIGMWAILSLQGSQYNWFLFSHQLCIMVYSGLMLALPAVWFTSRLIHAYQGINIKKVLSCQ